MDNLRISFIKLILVRVMKIIKKDMNYVGNNCEAKNVNSVEDR